MFDDRVRSHRLGERANVGGIVALSLTLFVVACDDDVSAQTRPLPSEEADAVACIAYLDAAARAVREARATGDIDRFADARSRWRRKVLRHLNPEAIATSSERRVRALRAEGADRVMDEARSCVARAPRYGSAHID